MFLGAVSGFLVRDFGQGLRTRGLGHNGIIHNIHNGLLFIAGIIVTLFSGVLFLILGIVTVFHDIFRDARRGVCLEFDLVVGRDSRLVSL